MAGILNKDPFTYQQEQNDFLKELRQFHNNRGTPITRIPRIGGKEVDLYLLYRRVIGFGGWRKVNDDDLWEQIQIDFHIPKSCSNGTQALKHVYIRHLDKYEKVHFHGQDPDSKYVEDDGDAPARKKVCLPIYGIPLSYNYGQHRVPELVRQTHGFSTDYVTISDYEKLEKSLMSGMPNEVDFVINVCTLLSNEGKHVLKLKRSHHLLNLLMAHIGIFVPGGETLEDVYESDWRKYKHRDFIHFWYDTVKDPEAKKLIITSRDYNRKPMVGDEVLNLGRDMGRHDLEGQRVLQMAVILRNLSFEEENATFMSSNDLVFRFLMLCIHSNYGSLRPLALDTLGNLAEKMVLLPDKEQTDMVLNLICRCLSAEDKLDVVRGLEILSKFCMKDENDVVLEERLDDRIYEDVIRLLGVYDIQIIVHSLEALYQLSEIGEHTATKIAAVKRAVDFLVTLLTIEAQAYGPNSLVGIKVVEYCPPPQAAGDTSTSPAPSLSNRNVPQNVPVKPGTNLPASCDVESTTCNWLQSTFEVKEGGDSLSQLHLYAEYITFSKKYAMPQLLPAQGFLNCVKIVFPKIEMVTTGKDDGSQEIVYKGLMKKLNPAPFTVHCSVKPRSSVVHPSAFPPTPSNPYATVDLNQTPTLRQRLMEPRLSSLQASPSLLPVGGASTLAKNGAISSATSMLLSSKLQSHQQQNLSPVQHKTPSRAPYPSQQLKQIQPAPLPSSTIALSSNPITTGSPSIVPSLGASQSIQPYPIAPKLATQPQVMAAGSQNLPMVLIQQVGQADTTAPVQQGNFPVFIQQQNLNQKSTETHMIKTLLAKKLRHNQSGPVPICPKMDPSNPMQLLTFTTQQSNVIQEQLQHPYMINSPVGTAVVSQYDQLAQIQGQVQVSVALDSPQSYQSQSSPSLGSICVVQSSQLGVSSPIPTAQQPVTQHPVTQQQVTQQPLIQQHVTQQQVIQQQVTQQPLVQQPLIQQQVTQQPLIQQPLIQQQITQQPLIQQQVIEQQVTHQSRPVNSDRSAKKKKNSPSRTKSSSTNSSRSSSPKSSSSPKPPACFSSQASPAPSPHPGDGDLEVCGEVECAKDVVTVGQEAMIERVENKCLDRIKNMQKTIMIPPQPSNLNPQLDVGLVPAETAGQSSGDQLHDTGQSVNSLLCGTGQAQLRPSTQCINVDQNVNASTITSSENVAMTPSENACTSISELITSSAVRNDSECTMATVHIENQMQEQTLFHPNQNVLHQEPQTIFSNILQSATEKLNGDIADSEDSLSSDINNANNNHAADRTLEEASAIQSLVKDCASEDDNVSQLESVSDMSETARAALNLEASYNDMEMNSIDDCVDEGVDDSYMCDVETIQKYDDMENSAGQILENGEEESLLVSEDTNLANAPHSEESCIKDDITIKDKYVSDVTAEVNGNYQEEIIPSPNPQPLLSNGLDSDDSCSVIKDDVNIQNAAEFKECMSKLSEKTMPKVNGIVINHVSNGEMDHYDGHSISMDYELSNDGLMGIDDENVQPGETPNGDEVKHVVIHAEEGDRVVINSHGCLEINGKVTNVDNLPTTADPLSTQEEDSEQVLAIQSILQEASEEDEDDYNNTSGQTTCYEITGEDDDDMMEVDENGGTSCVQNDDADEVIIENEMCLKPTEMLDQRPTAEEVVGEESLVEECPVLTQQQEDSQPVILNQPESCVSQPELPQNEDSTDSLPMLPENCDNSKMDIVEAAVASCDLKPQDGMDDIPCANTLTVGSIVQSIHVMPVSIGDMTIGQPLLGQPLLGQHLLGQPLVGQPPLARLPFPTILDMNMSSNSSDNLLKFSVSGMKMETSTNSIIYGRPAGHLDLIGGQCVLLEDDKSRMSSVQVMEVCGSRHVPTPEASRDSELSCDSVASSLTDSSTEKHSINAAIQGFQVAVAAAASSMKSANTTILQSTSSTATAGAKKSTSRSKSGEKRPKKRNRNTSGSADSRASSASSTAPSPEFVCEWANCKRCFENLRSVFAHVCSTHLVRDVEGVCLWEGCERLQRKRWSLYTHVQDHHCSELALKAAKLRRQQTHQPGTTTSTKPHTIPALVYPGDAAWQAIRRFTSKPPYPEFVEQKEGPVTKHIRLTAALVLRNLARYSSLGRSLIKKHERHIDFMAMSAVESSNALANCLWEIVQHH